MGKFEIWLRRQRHGALLSQAELARRAGVSVRTIGNLERGCGRRPHLATLRAVATALATARSRDEAAFLQEAASMWDLNMIGTSQSGSRELPLRTSARQPVRSPKEGRDPL
ncbi:MAG: helix-turn-helix domain-containing protein, partial [Pseudonocardia sp.]